MGTEVSLVETCLKEGDLDFPAVPPGFESFTSVKMKLETEDEPSCTASSNLCRQQSVSVKSEPGGDPGKNLRPRRRRSGINYGRINQYCDEDSDSEPLCEDIPKLGLPKGVIRGCADCQNCQKVLSGWRPEAACRPDLEEVPVFHPTQEEFKDTLQYIEQIRPKAEPYGICRIVPPPSWKPMCDLKARDIWETAKFVTRVQRVDKLQNRDASKKTPKAHSHARKKRRRCSKMGFECGAESGDNLEMGQAEFGFEPGPEFTLDEFQKYADDFVAQYFKSENFAYSRNITAMSTEKWKPTIQMIEGEYWRVVEKPTEEIEVLYGADLETGVFGSGFPKAPSQGCSSSDEEYVKSGWNLNNLPRLPGSVLSYENADISGVQVPWLYVGMCFSSFCWHVEDHHLYSLNYMHFGAPKMWYGVPGIYAVKLEEAMKKRLPDLFDEQPHLLHKLVTQISPSILKSAGVPVYRCVQNAGEFVLTFPRAYHAGFNCGFNCAEAVNVAPVDWFPHGQVAVELYREQGRKTTISHDKLLLGAAREAVKANWELNLLRKDTVDNLRWKKLCGKDGILTKSLRARVETEAVRRDFLCNYSNTIKMDSGFDSTTERECSICFFDLHLSAAGCRCSPDKYACLNHSKQLCPCGWGEKFFLFRYSTAELNLLVDALEGKLSATYRWARLDLGLALSSCTSKSNQVEGVSGSYSEHPRENFETKANSQLIVTPKGNDSDMKVLTDVSLGIGQIPSVQKVNPSVAVLALEATKIPPIKLSLHIKQRNDKSLTNKSGFEVATCKTDESAQQVVQRHVSCTQGSTAIKESKMKWSANGQDDEVICLSDDDDEDERPTKPPSDSAKESSPDVPEVVQVSEHHKLNLRDLAYAALAAEANSNLIFDGPKDDCLSCSTSPKDENDMKCQTAGLSFEQNHCCRQGSLGSSVEKRDPDDCTPDSGDQHIACLRTVGPRLKIRGDSLMHRGDMKLLDDTRTLPGSPSCSQSSVDKYPRQKGPRVAKVVRRINCNVELLEFGVITPGHLWSNSQAIFPKGFKSRVRYINTSDPTNMCSYVSEILDGGLKGPLFMVFLEHCPREVFFHVSPTRCWEMVRERVNQEITKHHRLGRAELPPLQPPGSLDGFEMFGFTSSTIIQGIEALDKNRVCSEYWSSRPLTHISQCSPSSIQNNQNSTITGVDTTLTDLLKKASTEELHSLMDMLQHNQSIITLLLNEEIRSRSRW